MAQTANTVFRDFVTEGVPSSGKNNPAKAEIRALLTGLETSVNAGLSNGGLIYDTKANMNADLAHPANASAWVIGDGTSANNGIYRKSGASGSGSWTRIGDLPYSVVYAQNAGAGSANGIVATSMVPVSSSAYSQLISVPFTASNTGPMTIAINGEPPRPLVLNTGGSIPSGYVSSGMSALVQIDSAGSYRLFSYGDASAIQSAAEAAAISAEADADRAETFAAMLSADKIKFPTIPSLTADEVISYTPGTDLIEVGEGDFIEAGGYRYEVAADNATDEDLETDGGVKVYAEARYSILQPEQIGAKGDDTTLDTDAIQKALDYKPGKVVLTAGKTYLTDTLSMPSGVNFEIPVGATLKLCPHTTSHNPVIRMGDATAGVSGAKITGGGVIDGNKAGQTYSGEEWSHGVFIWGSDYCVVEGVEIKDCQGDSVTIGYDTGRQVGGNGNSVRHTNIHGQNSSRQAIAVTYGNENEILFNRCSGNIDLEINAGIGECKNNLVMGNRGRTVTESREVSRISDLQIHVYSLDTDADHYFGNRIIGNTCCFIASGYGRKTAIIGNTIVGSNATQTSLVDIDASEGLVMSGNTLTANLALATSLAQVLRTRAGKDLVITDNLVDNGAVPFHLPVNGFGSATASNHYFRGNQVIGTGSYRATTPERASEWGLFRIDADAGTVTVTQLSGARLAGGTVIRSTDNIVISGFGGAGTATRIKFLAEGSTSDDAATTLDAAILAKIVASGSNRTCSLFRYPLTVGAVTLSAFPASTGTGTFFFEAWW